MTARPFRRAGVNWWKICSATLLFGVAVSSSVSAQVSAAPELFYVTVTVNGLDRRGIYPALVVESQVFLEASTLEGVGIIPPDVATYEYRRRQYLPVNAITGAETELNRGQQHLFLTCPASCFPSSALSAAMVIPNPDPTPIGGFLNYDLLAEKSGDAEFVGALAELGVFSNFGAGILGLSVQDLTGNARLIRLETGWTIDQPAKRQRIRLGDSVTQVGGWGQAVRFAGFQIGTDFGLQPGFISFPTPTIRGGAALPSTADIFVNGVRRGSIDIEPGAFTIEQPPVITGAGDLLVVVRDLLGRETVISHPFYASRNLLKPGLAEYSLEVGFLRQEFGVESFDYGEFFAAGSYRRGISNHFTIGLHGESSDAHGAIGPFLDWQLPFGGILSLAAAASRNKSQWGGLLNVNVSWQGDNIGFSASNEWITRDFFRLGSSTDFAEPRMETSVNLGVDVSDSISASFNYIRVDERLEGDQQIASANIAAQMGDFGTLSANFSKSFGEVDDTAFYLLFTTRLGEKTTAGATADRSSGRWSGSVRASRSAPSSGGFGWRAEATRDDLTRARGGITYNTGKGVLSLDHSQLGSRESTRLGMRGGVVVMGGDAFLANSVDDSFALVQVSDFEGVSVMRDNRFVDRTDKNGRVFVSKLRPYQKNRISINPIELPLTADIRATSMLPVPRRRSGVVVDFPISQLAAATARVVDENGEPLPPGTILRAEEGGSTIPVGYSGAIYVTGLQQPRQLAGQVGGNRCVVHVPAVKAGPFPTRIGALICKGVEK